MSDVYKRKYNTLLTTAKAIPFELNQPDGIDHEIAATFAVGDVTVSLDGAAEVNIANLPVDEGQGYRIILSAAELTAARVRITIVDLTATKVWLDKTIIIETYGNPNAMHAFDLDTASVPQTADNDTKISLIPTTPMRGTDSAALASVCTEVRLAELDAANLPTDVAAIPLTAMRGTDSALTDKAGFSLSSTGLDAIAQSATGMIEIAKAIWDRVLNGSTHNINNSAGKKLRQLQEAFIVDSGTAQAGAASSITLATTAPATTGILIGDRVTIDSGTGISEHALITAYNGTTKVATIYPPWTITPDATSTYTVSPASVDVSTWAGVAVTGSGDLAGMTTTLNDIVADTNELQTDDVPGLIATLPTAPEVNAEMVDVLEVDTHIESPSAVGATASLKDAIIWLKTLGRNKMTQTATTTLLRNDADAATISTSTVSDDGITFSKGKHL